MFCPNCGTKNKEEAKFCAKCGAALARASGAVAAPADAAVAIESAGKKWKLLAVAGIIAVLLIGGAYGVYTYSVDSRWGMQKEEAAPAPPPVDPNVVIADEARKSLSTYHEAITNHDFIQAYALMTSQKQSDLGTYEAWKDGYASTLSSKILDAKPTSVAPDRVIFAYQLEARDSEGSRIKKQIISGNVTMVRQGNLWLMADSDGRVISTTYE